MYLCFTGLNYHTDVMETVSYRRSPPFVGNSSNLSYPQPMRCTTEVVNYVEFGMLAFLAPCIMVGNITVLAAMVRFRNLRTCMNLLLANLAVCDLLVGVATAPLYGTMYLSETMCRSKWLCLAKFTAVIASFSGILMTLAVISGERYVAIFHSLHYNSWCTKKRVKIVIIGIWVYVIPISVLPLLGLNNWKESPVCEYFELLPKSLTIVIFIVTLGICFPVSTILFSMITHKIWSIRKHSKTVKVYQQRGQDCRSNKENRAGMMMPFIFLLFVIFWLPFAIAVPFRYLLSDTELMKDIKNITVIIAMGNSAVNPIVYCWCKVEIKKAMYSILFCKKRKRKIHTFDRRFQHKSAKDIFHVLWG